MSNAVGCPDIQKLRDYAVGRLAGAQADEVLLHAASCETCLTRITILAKNPNAEDLPHQVVIGPESTPRLSQSNPLASTRLYNHGPPDPVSPDIDTFDMEALDPSPRSNALGRLGPYDVLSVLGHGGMGMVFKAFEESLNREVAIKVLARQLATSSKSRQRFVREAQTAAAIRHPNVVTIHTVSDFRAVPYIVMEHLPGQTLQQRIKDTAPLEVSDVLRFGIQIAAGLAEAHKHQVIHRDVKPSNIMLVPGDDGERAVIMDFGIARVMLDQSDLTSHGAVMGTPAYMSPEQIRGLAVDPRTDLFSLGAVLFAMIHGRSPFQGGIPLEVARKVAELHTPPLRELHPHVPENLSQLVSRLLEKEPDKRFATAKDVVQQLKICLNDGGSSNIIPTPGKRGAPPDDTTTTIMGAVRNRRFVAWSSTGAVLLLAVWILWGRMGKQDAGDAGRSAAPPTPAATSLPNTINPADDSDPSGKSDPAVEITVAQDGSAVCTSLTEALRRARPNSIIRVLDSSTYTESLRFDDAERLAGVTLEATHEARLESANPKSPVIAIHDTPGVTIRGFRIEAPAQAVAVLIRGAVSGTTVDALIGHSANASPFVQVVASGGSSDDRPVTIRNSRVDVTNKGQCVWLQGTAETSLPIVLEHNRFHATDSLVVLWGTFDHVAIRHNVFVGGMNAVNLVLEELPKTTRIEMDHNTIYQTIYWLGLIRPRTDPSAIAITRNLILGSERVQTDLINLAQAASNWRFAENVWEAGDKTPPEADLNGRVAHRVAKFDLLSRDPDHPDFLRPRGDMMLPGIEPPSFVGAIAP